MCFLYPAGALACVESLSLVCLWAVLCACNLSRSAVFAICAMRQAVRRLGLEVCREGGPIAYLWLYGPLNSLIPLKEEENRAISPMVFAG